MKEIVFDHTCDSTNEAMGVCKDRSTEIEALVLYQIAFQQIMVEKLFGEDADRDEIPANFRTKTAILDKCLDYATDEQEQIYITWQFAKLDIKTDGPMGAMFLAIVTKKMLTLDLDEETFVTWFAKKKTEAEAENDEDYTILFINHSLKHTNHGKSQKISSRAAKRSS